MSPKRDKVVSERSIQFDHFYRYAEIDRFVRELAISFPALCRADSIGQSREGREIQRLTLTNFATGDPKARPAFVIHGGIHAHEPASAHAPLYTAIRLINDHEPGGLLDHIVFYVIPRLCPDASEFCIAASTRVRSRIDFENRESNVVYPEDIDGDGLILTLRQEHPAGRFINDPDEPRLLIKRRADSPPPYFRTFPEGYIHNWDGSERIRQGGLHSFMPVDPDLVGGRSFDWNRNWPYNWRPGQIGAGDYPFSELELKHFADFLYGHPKIFAVLGYHCGHASVIRPPASGSTEDMDPHDDRNIEELAQIGVRLTGTPILRLVKPSDCGKGGHSLDTIYHHLGILGFELELGTVMNAAGLKTEEFLQWKDGDADRWMRHLMSWWDARKQRDPLFRSWRVFKHPQLGPVDLGGLLYTTLDNPLLAGLPDTLEGTHGFTVTIARRHPCIAIEDLDVSRLHDRMYRISLKIVNRGRLPTNVTNKGRTLNRLQPVTTRFVPATDVVLTSKPGLFDLGHLNAAPTSRSVEWTVAFSNPQSSELGRIEVSGGTGGDIGKIVTIEPHEHRRQPSESRGA